MAGFSAFVDMGGYGGFVWPAYFIGLVVMGALFALSMRAARVNERELDLLQEMRRASGSRAGRRRAANTESRE